MKQTKVILLLWIGILILTACSTKEYKINQQISLKGNITTQEITKDNQTYKINILNLETPIIIDGTKINKIAIDYDKSLKEDINVTIDGTIILNKQENLDLEYAITVNDIDNILSYINTFSNEDFSMTIPVDIIKICDIREIENGFAIYKKDKNNNEVELFRIITISNEEFNTLREKEEKSIEKITSNREKTSIILYSSDEYVADDYTDYETALRSVDRIKETVVLK